MTYYESPLLGSGLRRAPSRRRRVTPPKPPKKTKPIGGSSQAPSKQPPAGTLPPTAPPASDPALAAISGYNLARAGLLKDVSPQIEGIFSRAADAVTGLSNGFSGALQGTLQAGSDQVAREDAAKIGADFAASTGVNPGEGYAPGLTADLTRLLGGYIPAASLRGQGAGFSAAASFLPSRALGEGQYALTSYLRDKAAQDAKTKLDLLKAGIGSQPKASASLSKTLGYLVDVYGNPIRDKKGKAIPVSENLTPYQAAALAQRQQSESATNARFYAGLQFKSAQAAAKARQLATTIDWTASKKAGIIVLKDGTIAHDKHGRTLKFVSPAAPPKPPSVTQGVALSKQLDIWAHGAAPKYNANGDQLPGAGAGAIPYQQAIQRLMTDFGKTRAQAVNIANQHYAAGVNGRPLIDTATFKKLVSKGVPRDAITRANKDPNGPDAKILDGWIGQNYKLDASDVVALRQKGISDKLIARAQRDRRYAFRLYSWLYTQA